MFCFFVELHTFYEVFGSLDLFRKFFLKKIDELPIKCHFFKKTMKFESSTHTTCLSIQRLLKPKYYYINFANIIFTLAY